MSQSPIPLLRWAGSKKRYVKQLAAAAPAEYSQYIELFCGSACLLFEISPEVSIINDSNSNVINFYNKISTDPELIWNVFISIPRTRESYYEIRSAVQHEVDSFKSAAYFYFLNRNCFNGIYRTNIKGHFNVPYADKRVPPYPTKELFLASAEAIAGANRTCGDFEAICRDNIKRKSFVYLDPPYYVTAERVFREYSAKPFVIEDLIRLDGLLDFIDRSGSYFMLSYPLCDEIKAMSGRWRSETIQVRRTVSGNASFRKTVPELLIRNY